MRETISHERLTKEIGDWLLAILRFAVTLDPDDRSRVLSQARELDRPGIDTGTNSFAFFVRTSFEFCNAVADRSDPRRGVTVRKHLARISEPRLRGALEGAIGLEPTSMPIPPTRRDWQDGLWKGLKPVREA